MVSEGVFKRRNGGQFFGRRVNCEHVPLLPAWAVARMLDDPRKIPYLLLWKNRDDGPVQEAVRVAPHSEIEGLGRLDWTGAVEIKRHDGTRNFVRTVVRPLPRNGGRVRLLLCPYCNIPRRGLYSWIPAGPFTTSVVRSNRQCRFCAGLRYASEGGALIFGARGSLGQMLGGCRGERPQPWYPYVFTSPQEAAEAGLCTLKP